MDSFDYQDHTQPTRNVSSMVWNTLTVLVLLAVLCVGVGFLMIFLNPNSAFNPFPPPTLPPTLTFPTVTPTPRGVLPATWTPLPTDEPTATGTPRPTSTPIPTETPFSLFTPTETSEASPTVVLGMPYDVAPGSPVAISSAAFHPEAGCNWIGVAGQVLDMTGAPVSTGVVIQLSGVFNGQFIEKTSLTGIAPQYGQAGYEFYLGDTPTASNKTLWVQLLDQAGAPLSDKIYFETYGECGRNLTFINFKQKR
jgi:hypothetical protein